MAQTNPDKSLKYGFDKEVAQAMEAKFDAQAAEDVIKWIGSLSGSNLTGSDLSVLKSGVDLCLAANKLQPGVVASINKMNSPFFQRENIKNFLDAARKMGVRDGDLFVTEDLYIGNNYIAVIDCLRAYNGAAVKKGLTTTVIGIASAGEKNVDQGAMKFQVKATGDTSGMTKQTSGSVYFGAESVRSDAIIKSSAASVNPNQTTKQTSGSVVQNAEKRMDNINRMSNIK